MPNWLAKLFEAIDRMDADGFVAFLTAEASFRFGSAPPVRGAQAIREALVGFFSSIRGLRHEIGEVWDEGNTLLCEGTVTYTRQDGREVALPFLNVFRMQDELIDDYRIYMDLSPLFAN